MSYTSYYNYQKYETRNGTSVPCYPATYSIDGDGTKPLVKKKDNDEGCGYVPPIEPIYRWVNINIETDYMCDDCPIMKFSATYSDGTTYSIDCDDDTTLTTGNTKPSGYEYTAMTESTIGECVTNISWGAFSSCHSLTSIDIPSSVTSIGDYAFYTCYSLTSITIPNSVTSIGSNAFASCSGLTSANIPTGLTSIPQSLFDYDSNIEGTLEIPSGVTSIGSYAFYGCKNLDALICRPVVPPTVGSGIIGGNTSFPVYVPCESVDAYKAASGWSEYASRITAIPGSCAEGKFKATYSGGTSYSAKCDSSSVLTSGDTKPSGYNYSAMTSAEVGQCITNIGDSAFSNCSSLTNITIPNSVTSIGNGAFYHCSSLTSIDIHSGVTSIGWSAFAVCSSLTNVTIPDNVTYIGPNVFQNCSGLTSCTIGNGVTNISWGAFSSCHSLTSIDIPSSVTSIGELAFRDCTNLTSIDIPNSVTTIGKQAFYDCSSITSVIIPSGVTSIENNTFERCTSLTGIAIPDNVTSIGASAFYNCSGLTSVTVESATPATLGSGVFDNTNNCPIYVPAESVDAYKTAWPDYSSRITAKQ